MIYLTDLIAWALVHVGAVYLITESAIFSPFRRLLTSGFRPTHLLVALVYCTGCVGFWLGLLEGALGLTIFCPPEQRFLEDALTLPPILTSSFGLVVLTGCAGMGLGAWWGTNRPGPGVMRDLETTPPEERDVDATAGPQGPSSEDGDDDGDDATDDDGAHDADRPDGDGGRRSGS